MRPIYAAAAAVLVLVILFGASREPEPVQPPIPTLARPSILDEPTAMHAAPTPDADSLSQERNTR